MADTKRLSRPQPRKTRALASVPPEVNTSSAPSAWMAAAMAARDCSSKARARLPNAWTEDGLPAAESASTMAATTSGRAGAPAL